MPAAANQPSPPAAIIVGPFTYALLFDRAKIDAASVAKGDELEGSTQPHRLEILVAPDLPAERAQEVTLHETLHAIIDASGLLPTLERWAPDAEEVVVGALSPLLLDTLRRNPDLLGWLTR